MKIDIRQPFFGAWKKYGWPKGTWGIGIKRKKITDAGLKGEKITITLRGKPTEYQITPKKALIHGKLFMAKFNTKLLVIPLFQFDKVKKVKYDNKTNTSWEE